jgi:hypothetical protein
LAIGAWQGIEDKKVVYLIYGSDAKHWSMDMPLKDMVKITFSSDYTRGSGS